MVMILPKESLFFPTPSVESARRTYEVISEMRGSYQRVGVGGGTDGCQNQCGGCQLLLRFNTLRSHEVDHSSS